jgi:hypothetical protein
MLNNHAKPPGPSNRGLRSEIIYDKRPISEQINDNIVDTEKPTRNGKEFRDLEEMIRQNCYD